eukprot:676368-Pyramimonas_sp.AAC.1
MCDVLSALRKDAAQQGGLTMPTGGFNAQVGTQENNGDDVCHDCDRGRSRSMIGKFGMGKCNAGGDLVASLGNQGETGDREHTVAQATTSRVFI